MPGMVILSGATIVAGALLVIGFGASLRGRRRLCAGSVVVGLAAAAVAIHVGFDGLDDAGDAALAPVVFGKLAIGLALLLFAVGWVTWLSPQRGSAAFGFGRSRTPTRRASRPDMAAFPPMDARSPASRRMTRPEVAIHDPRSPASRSATRPSTGPHVEVGPARTRRKTVA